MFLNFWKGVLFYGIRLYEGEPAAGGISGSGDPAGDPAGDPTGTDPASVSDTVNLKPEGLEDSFWDADKGEVRIDGLIKSYGDTKAKLSSTHDAIREKVLADMQKQRPEAPDKYEIASDIGIELPEGYELQFDDNDPMIGMWRDLAFQNNLSNDQFMEGIRKFVEVNMGNRPDPAAELTKLGENGQDRVTRIDNLLSKHLEQGEVDELADFIGTASGVEILEKLFAGIGGNAVADVSDVDQISSGKGLTLDELKEMQQDDRYTGRNGTPRSNEFIKKVADGYKKLYPDKAIVQQNR